MALTSLPLLHEILSRSRQSHQFGHRHRHRRRQLYPHPTDSQRGLGLLLTQKLLQNPKHHLQNQPNPNLISINDQIVHHSPLPSPICPSRSAVHQINPVQSQPQIPWKPSVPASSPYIAPPSPKSKNPPLVLTTTRTYRKLPPK